MKRAVIEADRIGKEYFIGGAKPHQTFREAFADGFSFNGKKNKNTASRFWALKDVSFQVHEGEIVGVIGRNGAGKSTLLKILSRITEPTTGRAVIRGRVASLLEVGTGFHPDLTGRENIYLNGTILGMKRSEIDRKLDAIIAFAEIAKFVDTPVRHYSSGMYVRLAFAVAAHLDPEILLVDEVLAVGDIAFQEKCLGKIRDVQSMGRTVLFVSHNLSVMNSLCHRGLLLEKGVVEFSGDVLAATGEYLSRLFDLKESCVPLSETKRTIDSHGEFARLSRLEVLGSQGQKFQVGEGLRFRLAFRSYFQHSKLSIGVGIDDIFGRRLATFEGKQQGFNFGVEAGKEYVVELVVPNPSLNPGKYFLSASVSSGQQYFDLLLHMASFEIEPRLFDGGAFFEPIPGTGPHFFYYDWRQVVGLVP